MSDAYSLRWYRADPPFPVWETHWTNWTKYGAFWALLISNIGKHMTQMKPIKKVWIEWLAFHFISLSDWRIAGHVVKYRSQPLVQAFPKLSSVGFGEELAELCLKLEPKHRISAKNALKHKYFSDLPQQIFNLADSERSSAFDTHTTYLTFVSSQQIYQYFAFPDVICIRRTTFPSVLWKPPPNFADSEGLAVIAKRFSHLLQRYLFTNWGFSVPTTDAQPMQHSCEVLRRNSCDAISVLDLDWVSTKSRFYVLLQPCSLIQANAARGQSKPINIWQSNWTSGRENELQVCVYLT